MLRRAFLLVSLLWAAASLAASARAPLGTGLSGAHGRALRQGFGSDRLTSQGTCVQALSMVPSDVDISGMDCGEGGLSGGPGGSGGCPATTAGPSALQFMAGQMVQAIETGHAEDAGGATSLASAILLAQFLAAGDQCLTLAPTFYQAVGQAVQAGAAQVCGAPSAGNQLAVAIASAPLVMSAAVSPQLPVLQTMGSAGVQQAILMAAQAVLPSITEGYSALVSACQATAGIGDGTGSVAEEASGK